MQPELKKTSCSKHTKVYQHALAKSQASLGMHST